MPKKKNIKTGSYITFGLKPEQKKELEKEAEEQDISLGKLMRKKVFEDKKEE